MSRINQAFGDTVETRLRYIGATEIRKINGILYFIEFDIEEDLKVVYTYNINSKDKYFLQRVKPYPIPEGVFEKEHEIVKFIEQDIKKFKNAKNSNNFKLFLSLTKKVNTIYGDMEKLFLNYNVDKVDLVKLRTDFDDVKQFFEEAKKKSMKIDIE